MPRALWPGWVVSSNFARPAEKRIVRAMSLCDATVENPALLSVDIGP